MREIVYRRDRESYAREVKVHNRNIRLARTQISAISEQAKETGDLPIWDKVKGIVVTLTGAHEGSRKLSISDLERLR